MGYHGPCVLGSIMQRKWTCTIYTNVWAVCVNTYQWTWKMLIITDENLMATHPLKQKLEIEPHLTVLLNLF